MYIKILFGPNVTINLNIFHLVYNKQFEQQSYSSSKYGNENISCLKKGLITLLISINLAVKTRYFIGPYSSNVSKIIYLLRNGVGYYNSELLLLSSLLLI